MTPLRRGPRRFDGFAVVAAMVSIAVVGACEGPNQFTGPALSGDGGIGSGGAPRVEIQAPRGDSLTARPIGDSVLVQARVRDDRGITTVRFLGQSERGDPALGTDVTVNRFQEKTVELAGVRDTVVSRYLVATSDTTKEVTSIIVEAVDIEGNKRADTVRITLGGPSVDILNLTNNQSVQAGLSLSLQLEASDPEGILGVEFRITGAFESTIRRSFSPPRETVRLDTVVAIPAGVTGTVDVVAVARNTLDISGQDGPIRLRIVQGGGGDETPPSVSMQVVAPDRLETRDSVRVQITAADNTQGSGIVRAGVTVQATAPGRGVSETRVFTRDFQSPRTGTVTETLAFPSFNIDPIDLPDTLVFEITGFVVDAQGNCAATVATGQTQSLACTTGAGGAVTATGRTGFRLLRTVVAGRTVTLPSGGRIMDAAVDTVRRNLLLSNFEADRVEVYRLQSESFLTSVPVGSEPWGLSINNCFVASPRPGCGDTLLVANSGGTNLSSVYLGPSGGTGPMFEVPARRLLTPDVTVWNAELRENEGGALLYLFTEVAFFSDRPQFLAVDSVRRMHYSTKTTETGSVGSLRRAFVPPGLDPSDPGVRPEVKLFHEYSVLTPIENRWAVAHLDSIKFGGEGAMYDHVPGRPGEVIAVECCLGSADLEDMEVPLQAAGSDAYIESGQFTAAVLGWGDTTFVTSSGDGGWVAFGEGGSTQASRIMLYDAGSDRPSEAVPIRDLILNAAEVVRGLGLNYDGTLGLARGDQAYYFTTDLRLQGVANLPGGGAGAAFHPLHANAKSLDNPAGEYRPDTQISFVGTGERTIDIVDTFHFFRSGRIFIRDVVTGPLRATLPFPEDNVGNRCQMVPVRDRAGNLIGETVEIFAGGDFTNPHPPDGPSQDQCIVVKLFGVTDTGGVVAIDVRKSDILRSHPSRN